MTDWQPINTAPKDGKTHVWLKLKDGIGGFEFKIPCIFKDGDWYSNRNPDILVKVVTQATHWMPIPTRQ